MLPVIQALLNEGHGSKKPYGRTPKVLVLAPTRELAKQVAEDFELVGQAGDFSSICLYGGTPYGPQEGALRRGVDIVIGTPGRVKDHLERGTLNLGKLRFRVLDECDEMLNMGFKEDVELILKKVEDPEAVQTLLFSATMPPWVREVTRQFLKPSKKMVDLVGDDKMKAATTVKHLLLPCHWQQAPSIVVDLVRSYGAQGRSIIFTETKNDANELATKLSEIIGARPLHGDIPQQTREVTLKGFKTGKFHVLVATDVAARGLDISGVELVIQMAPPKDPETYIHRSGRTGRAGSTGVSITFCSRSKEGLIPIIERKGGFKFERIGAPQPSEIASVAAERAVDAIREVDLRVIGLFEKAAGRLMEYCEEHSLETKSMIALVLAKLVGTTEFKRRSLLTASDDFCTLMFTSDKEVERPGYVFGYLRRRLPEEMVNEVKR